MFIFCLQSTSAAAGSYPWTPTEPPGAGYYIAIYDTGGSGQKDFSDQTFRLKADPNAPTLAITKPMAGERWQYSTTHNINWTAKGDFKEMRLWFELTTNGGDTWKKFAGDLDPKRDGSFPWEVRGGRGHILLATR